ncbi:MAG: glycoside hydrolase domain-containing protein [Candidatus Hydrogenedentota bacterium]
MYRIVIALAVLLAVSSPFLAAQPADADAEPAAAPDAEAVVFEGNYVHTTVDPAQGALLTRFAIAATGRNLAGDGGLLFEGFGIGSYYVPNRRLNAQIDRQPMKPDGGRVLVHTYECDGPNIRGLEVTKRLELLPGEAAVRVLWQVENKGDERQWVTPWVQNNAAPGGELTADDRLTLPTVDGVRRVTRTAYYPAARNWAAVTDPDAAETVYGVFNADQLHSVRATWKPEAHQAGFRAHFAPFILEAGDAWETVYRVNAVRGLTQVDFATDELALQLDYEPGQLTALLSAARPMESTEIFAVVVAENGRRWELQPKRFSITPNRLARCTYDWTAPGDGAYEFLAQLRRDGETVFLGRESRSPHGGIDTQFTVGAGEDTDFAAWTDAPYALERGPRSHDHPLAVTGPIRGWFAPALEKVFPGDAADADAARDNTAQIALARNEAESFQLALRPAGDDDVYGMEVRVNDLTQVEGDARIPAADIAIYRVDCVPVRVPSYFEGATGDWPDVLVPVEGPITLPAGRTTPLWFTLRTSAATAPGAYSGIIELHAAGIDPIEVFLEVQVYDFALPDTPHLKTDFGFSREAALAGARAQGGDPEPAVLEAAYRDNAFAHRVTLRPAAALPREHARYDDALDAYASRLETLRAAGATTFAVPASLLEVPDQLAMAADFIEKHGLESRAFVHLANEPAPGAWTRLLERMQAWEDAAPGIPMMVTTQGLEPFLHEGLDIWAVHTRVLDTANGGEVLARAAGDNEAWWYVHHAPPRPYPNFFLDFAGIEHRALFWQAWVMNITGLHYFGINANAGGQNPYENQLDVTPVNGNGLLVYPGADGPVNSVRWEIIRDGIEDYDYLALFDALHGRLAERGGHDALRERALEARNLGEIVPSLTGFTRDPAVLLEKRRAIARAIEAMQRALR